MQEKMCESCGAPMGEFDEMYGPGTEADGSKSEDYCKQCYDNGVFTNPNITLEEMIETVAAVMVNDFGFSPEDAKEQCNAGLPTLKRWKTV
ncbi:MAG: zinc ribbon domain-containing protein [Defluviitaleaceae bacterium]|nr:zinc ribbon domain-containing protein [Defluviitaleaceae bacterium]